MKTLVIGADEIHATEWMGKHLKDFMRHRIVSLFGPSAGGLLNYDRQPFITDSGLAMLAALPLLDTLIISHCGLITDSGLQSLARFPALRELQLNGASITGTGCVSPIGCALPASHV